MNRIEDLRKTYVGKRIHVCIEDDLHPINADGVVKFVDDMGQLHGTWGGLAALESEVVCIYE